MRSTTARTKFARAKELAAKKLIAQTELEAAEVAVRSAEAQLRSQEAGVTQSQASLRQNQVNLAHTVIESPIDGLVISRNVDVGQTVAASMSAPTLFVLAADLTKMQVLASLDESDVGRIRPGQAVRFRVDAFPTDEFTGNVTQVRLQPTTVQNVVTYQTVIDVPNPGLKLKPGMTANVNIEIARRNNVLRVPNARAAVPADGRDLRCAGTDSATGWPAGRRPRTWRRRWPRHTQRATGASAQQRSSRWRSSNRPLNSGPRRNSAEPRETAHRKAKHHESAPQADGCGTADGSWRGWRRGEGGGRRGGRGNFAERMASMTPEERERFMERMRARGFTPPADGQTPAAARRAEARGQGPRQQGPGTGLRPARARPPRPRIERDDVRRAVRPPDADRDHSGRSG